MRIIDRIDELISENSLTSKQLAHAIGVSPGNVTEWRKGRATPSADVISKIADYFNVTADYLLGRSDQRYPHESIAASSDIPYDKLPPEAVKQINDHIQYIVDKYGKKE